MVDAGFDPPFDLSWLWDSINAIIDRIVNFFQGIWDYVSNVTNTGQGIFAGLTTFISGLWDAIVRFAESFYEAITVGLSTFGRWFREAFYQVGQWFWITLGNIGNAIYSAFQWIYNGLAWVASQFANVIVNAWNTIVESVESLWNQLTSLFSSIPSSVNSYFANLVSSFREKLKLIIATDIMIAMSWDAIADLRKDFSMKGMLKAFAMPVASFVAGTVFASALDAVLPHTNLNVKLIPEFTLPSITLPRMSVPEVPALPTPEAPPSPTLGYGLPYDVGLELPSIKYDYTTFSKTVTMFVPEATYDTTTDTTDGTLGLPSLAYETEVA